MKYVFYESFYFPSNTSTMRTRTWIVNKVTCWTNPQASLVAKMQREHGTKYASVNKHSNKLYVRERVRRATVKYKNQTRFHNPEFVYSFTENRGLTINLVKERDKDDITVWRTGTPYETS